MKGLSVIIALFLFSASIELNAQELDSEKKRIGIEYMGYMLGVYNNASFGFSRLRENGNEHLVVGAGNYVYFWTSFFNWNLNYSYNFYEEDQRTYIPVWMRISNTRRDVGYEEGYNPHSLVFSIGSGAGRLFQVTRSFFVRVELGAGIGAKMQNDIQGPVLTHRLDLLRYSFRRNRRQWYDPYTIQVKLKINLLNRI